MGAHLNQHVGWLAARAARLQGPTPLSNRQRNARPKPRTKLSPGGQTHNYPCPNAARTRTQAAVLQQPDAALLLGDGIAEGMMQRWWRRSMRQPR
eukprot:scaffold104853_cov60-Phaeocystis_antarctica.AAC.2